MLSDNEKAVLALPSSSIGGSTSGTGAPDEGELDPVCLAKMIVAKHR